LLVKLLVRQPPGLPYRSYTPVVYVLGLFVQTCWLWTDRPRQCPPVFGGGSVIYNTCDLDHIFEVTPTAKNLTLTPAIFPQ